MPRKFLEHIMLEMKTRGSVNSIAGRDRRFELVLRPEDLSIGQVDRHFNGQLAPITCVSTTPYVPCTQEGNGRFRRVFLDICNDIARILDGATFNKDYVGEVIKRG